MGNAGIDVLSKISGINKTEIKKIALGVIKNNKKLNGCLFHDFSTVIGSGLRIKYECKNCGGIVDGVKKKYYELGLEHFKNRR